MISYMPKKPVKCALVIKSFCDGKNAYNGYVYNGKGSNGVGLTTQDKKLPIAGSRTSVELQLARRKLTDIGTMKKTRNSLQLFLRLSPASNYKKRFQ